MKSITKILKSLQNPVANRLLVTTNPCPILRHFCPFTARVSSLLAPDRFLLDTPWMTPAHSLWWSVIPRFAYPISPTATPRSASCPPQTCLLWYIPWMTSAHSPLYSSCFHLRSAPSPWLPSSSINVFSIINSEMVVQFWTVHFSNVYLLWTCSTCKSIDMLDTFTFSSDNGLTYFVIQS